MSEPTPENISFDEDVEAVGQADADADAVRAGADVGETTPRFADDGALAETDRSFAEEGGTAVGSADAQADAENAGAD